MALICEVVLEVLQIHCLRVRGEAEVCPTNDPQRPPGIPQSFLMEEFGRKKPG